MKIFVDFQLYVLFLFTKYYYSIDIRDEETEVQYGGVFMWSYGIL